MKKILLFVLLICNIIAFGQEAIILDSEKYFLNMDMFEKGTGILQIEERLENGTKQTFKPQQGKYFYKNKKENFEFFIDEKGNFSGTAHYSRKEEVFVLFIFENGKVVEADVADNVGNPVSKIEINDTLFVAKDFDKNNGKLVEKMVIKNGGGEANSIKTSYYENGNIETERDNISKTYKSFYENGTLEKYNNHNTEEYTHYNEKGSKIYYRYQTNNDDERCEEYFDDNQIIERKECSKGLFNRITNYYYKNGKLDYYEEIDHIIGELKKYDKNKKLMQTEKIAYPNPPPDPKSK